MIVKRYWSDAQAVPFVETIEWRAPAIRGFGISITVPDNAYVEDQGDELNTDDTQWVSIAQPAYAPDSGTDGDLYVLPLADGVTIVTYEEFLILVDAYRQKLEEADAERVQHLQEVAQTRADALAKIGEATGLTEEEVNALVGGA